MSSTFERQRNGLLVAGRLVAISFIGALSLASLTTVSLAENGDTVETSRASGHQRFMPVDIFVDPHGEPLAAYQLEFVDRTECIRIVGVEGGETQAFKAPPYYDPKALRHHRVVVAAFSTAADLPTSKSRVTTLHILQAGETEPDLNVRLITAAKPTRERIDATATFITGAAK